MPELRFASVTLDELRELGLVADSLSPPPLILVVDDEKVIADTLVMILKRKGFAAIPAYGGVSALQIAAVTPPNLLLTDVVMPDMNGIDLAIEICRQVLDCDVLLLSGQAATTDLLARYPEIADSFTVLPKPIHPLELMVRLAHLLPTNIPESPAV